MGTEGIPEKANVVAEFTLPLPPLTDSLILKGLAFQPELIPVMA